MKKTIYLLMVVICLMLSSCASIVSGGSPKITLQGHSDEPVTITTSKGVYSNVYLPMEVKVNRHGLDGQRISITSEHFTYPDVVLEKRINGWAYGNILAGGFIGWGVDLATNAVVVPKQKTFIISGTPKNNSIQRYDDSFTQNIAVPSNPYENVEDTPPAVIESTGMTVSSKSLKDNASKVEGTYVGTGNLSQNRSVIESYEGIYVTIKKSGKDIVMVNVIESDGEEFFESNEKYSVKLLSNGKYELTHINVNSAKITIDTNKNLVYIHPRVNIEGDMYSLGINAKKQLEQ